MRSAEIRVHGRRAGLLKEIERARRYELLYDEGYEGPPVSLTLPVRAAPYAFDGFPAFFDGLLPEGGQLEALLRLHKIDRSDLFAQLLAVGRDMVGAVTALPIGESSR